MATATTTGDDSGKLLFFASDGLRQDAVEKYADDGDAPGFRELLRHGTKASDHGLLTQAPPNTGAGWFTLTHRRVAGRHGLDQQHVPHQRRAVRRTRRRRSTRRASCRPRRSPRRPSAAARRSPRSSGPAAAAARSTARRSTTATSAPAAAWRRTTSRRRTCRGFTRSFGLQFDHPAGFAGNAPFPQAAPAAATGWTNVPRSYSPAKEMRLRVIDAGVDKYGLNAYIYDAANDRKTRYDRVLFSRTKSGADSVGDLEEGEWADVKVKIVDRRRARTARPPRS